MTKTNLKSNHKDQITSVIPLANASRSSIEFEALPCMFAFHWFYDASGLTVLVAAPNKGLSLTFKGPSYPSSTTLELVPQSFNVRILCATDTSDPQFVSYDGREAKVEWSSSAGCSFGAPGDATPPDPPSDDNGKDDEKAPEKVGSGLGHFILLYVRKPR